MERKRLEVYDCSVALALEFWPHDENIGTIIEAVWDFVDETENGTDNIWWINEGQDYPRLWWERFGGTVGQ